MRPALDVPAGVPPSPSTVAAQGSIAIAKGRRTAIRDLAAIVIALAIGLFGLTLLEAGSATFPLLLTLIAMITSPTFWLRGVTWTNDALAPALAMLALWAGWRWLNTARRSPLITAVISGTLAIIEDPAWIVLLPGAALLCSTHLASGRQRLNAGLIVIGMAACGIWPFIVRAIVAGQLAGPHLAGDTPGAMTLWRQSLLAVDPGALLPALRASMSGEFTLMGAGMAALGAALLLEAPRTRYAAAATLAMLLGWFWIAPRAPFENVSVPLAIAGWAAVAVALTTLYRVAVRRLGAVVVLVASITIAAPPSLGRARALAASAPDTESDTRSRLAYEVRIADLPDGTALVAETRRVDATLLLAARQSGRQLTIVPQTIEHVVAAAAGGGRVAALPGARANLERAGFVFERGWLGNMPLHMVGGRGRCVDLKQGEPVDVSFQLASGSFSLHGLSANARPGTALVRMTGVPSLPVASAEPRRLRYEITSPLGAPEVSLRILRTSVPATVVVHLTGAPATAVATAETDVPVTVCSGPQRADPMLSGSDTAHALIDMRATGLFGSGWHSPEADPDPFRWTGAARATLVVTVASPGPVRVTVTATPAARPERQPSIALAVNGCALPSQSMVRVQGDYAWDVPAECWQPGVNQMFVMQGPLVSPSDSGSADTRQMGARVGAIRLARLPRDPATR